jgi:hypothetical protein
VRVAKQQNYPLPEPQPSMLLFPHMTLAEPFSASVFAWPMLLDFLMATRETFPFDDIEIKPRPLFPTPAPEPIAPPVQLPEPRAIAPKGTREVDGPTRDQILLTALTIVARREPQTVATRGAMRELIRRHSVECGLGF